MRHIDRIVWKPIDWSREPPDQYADGIRVGKRLFYDVDFDDSTSVTVWAEPLGCEVRMAYVGQHDVDVEVCLDDCPTVVIPADKVHDVVDAVLYVHRRTHEHEYQGPDVGLSPEDA